MKQKGRIPEPVEVTIDFSKYLGNLGKYKPEKEGNRATPKVAPKPPRLPGERSKNM